MNMRSRGHDFIMGTPHRIDTISETYDALVFLWYIFQKEKRSQDLPLCDKNFQLLGRTSMSSLSKLPVMEALGNVL